MLKSRSAMPGANSGNSSLCRFFKPGGPIDVTTNRPSGETCDMNPNRFTDGSELLVFGSSRNELHRITSTFRIVMFLLTGTIAYRPLSFFGPSMSRPSVLPSVEKEWQLAQVGRSSMTVRLWVSPMLRNRHLISGIAKGGSGCIKPFDSGGGIISGTSR